MTHARETESGTRLRVGVDKTKCCGFGNCWDSTPEVFEVTEDDGLARAVLEFVPGHLEQAVRYAEERCPQGAIKVEDTGQDDRKATS